MSDNASGKIRVYKPSKKAVKAWREAQDYFIALLEGAVRSSKSYTADQLAFDELRKMPPCNVLLSGKSATSVGRNILGEWKRKLGERKFKFHKIDDAGYWSIDHDGLRGKKFFIAGASKAKDEEKIQGATFGYWYADEVALHTQEFVNMAISRLSLPYSKARWTCNPDRPTHYIKTDFIDRVDELNQNGAKKYFYHIKFMLDDNPSLNDDYKNGLKAFYTGVFYRRFIKGEWVSAEGAIYNMFDRTIHTYESDKVDFSLYQDLGIGVDYGYNNATVYLFLGERYDGSIDVIDEWYWRGKQNKHMAMDDMKLAQEMVKFIRRQSANLPLSAPTIAVDPSASSLIAMFRRKEFGLSVVLANNDVLNGIRDVQVKFAQNRLRINKKCTNLIDELESYCWDEEASLKKGVDVPVKDNDHGCDALKYCCYSLFPERWNA